jgi:hypothetical protein
MNTMTSAGRGTVRLHSVGSAPAPHRFGSPFAVPVPSARLLTRALPRFSWSDAYAMELPAGGRTADPEEWAGAIFQNPPWWVRLLFGVRQLLVRAVGIERGDGHTFAILDWREDEVLVGTDQQHLDFRASVLVSPGRVVVSTLVGVRNRRGLAYWAVVQRLHPFVVRSMMARAARTMGVSA